MYYGNFSRDPALTEGGWGAGIFICVTVHKAARGGLEACPPPRKILDFRPSEIISGAVLGFSDERSAASASHPGYKAMQTDCALIVCYVLARETIILLALWDQFSMMTMVMMPS